MAFNFKIWNQGNDGSTMGVRVEDVAEVARFAEACNEPDVGGHWNNLQEYLDAADAASGAAPQAYTRIVNVVWLNTIGYGSHRYFPGRTLVVTYTGPERQAGGFASQAYCIIDPHGHTVLSSHHRDPIAVEYISHPHHDVLVVMP